MSEDPTVVDDESTVEPRRGLTAAQKTLVLGMLLAAGFVAVLVVFALLTDDGPAPTEGGPENELGQRVPADRQAPLPDQTLEGFAGGEPVDLSEYRGQPLVVNFWASWCAPCIKEMPDFQQVWEESQGDVALLGVNVQDAPSNAEAFVESLGVTYDLARDPAGELYRAVGGFGMPTTLFVDEGGTIVWRHTGLLDAQELREGIREHLGAEV